MKLSEDRKIHLLCKKHPLFMAETLMKMKYFDPLVLDFDQEHKIPHIDAESYKIIQKSWLKCIYSHDLTCVLAKSGFFISKS